MKKAILIQTSNSKEYKLGTGYTNTLGSHERDDIRLEGATVKERHAGIRCLAEGNIWMLFNISVDKASVRHKGRPVSEHAELTDGDRINICGTQFTFTLR